MNKDSLTVGKYDGLSREELIKCLDALEREKTQILKNYEVRTEQQNDYQAQERLAILKAAVNIGDSLIWEYDVENDTIHVDYELNAYGRKAPSRLKIEPFRKREDFLNTIYPDDRQNVYYNHFIRLINGEISSYSIQYRRLFEDQIVWVEANVQPYKYDAHGKPSHVVYYLSDITEQKLFQDKLYKLEDKYRKIIKAIPDAVFTLTENAEILDIYAGTSQNLIYTFHLQEGKMIDDLFPDEVAISLHSAITTTVQTQKEQNLYFPILSGETKKYYYSRIIPYETNEVLIMLRDATEFLQNKKQVDFLNDLMRAILDNIPVIVVVKEVVNDFRLLYINAAAEDFMGMKTSEALGKNDFDIYPEQEQAERIRKIDMEVLENLQNVQYAEKYVTPKGEHKVMNVIRVLINNPTRKDSPLLISMVWDITREMENELQLVKAREADKLKSAFLANMSHEIRTPLNAIVGFSSLLAEAESQEESQEFISIINKNNELLLQLIDDILDISKIEAGMLEYSYSDIDLKDICIELYNIHSLKIKPGVKMLFDFEHPSILLHTDERRVKQVMSNFLTNAIKFTGKGTITIAYELRGDTVYVSVEDTGSGISAENKETIFDRFVKLNRYQQGTGLGLAISKMIIEHLGGSIGVDSEEGKGSTFWFTLPLVSFGNRV
ncbi:ATP-binding protein [Parabacteroides sp. AM08-6]|uniref:PAS domain-containing sensor histidine kinase n=1 Tax=Parabacteroides sp. AM08-6 TaxID=2292053 RepID=UPI000EFEA448|nr:ATP-binding protein [Parabacteroides sp. AM08-6]RHJ85400.1 PAS domain S-box protein [Parabacteroides sp. AM08-6]